jgi:hypothetical protein
VGELRHEGEEREKVQKKKKKKRKKKKKKKRKKKRKNEGAAIAQINQVLNHQTEKPQMNRQKRGRKSNAPEEEERR